MKKLTIPILLGALALTSCSKDPAAESGGRPSPAPAAAMQALVLRADPGPSLGVDEAKRAGATPRVAVEGRVHDVIKGFAILKLMDASLPYCGQDGEKDRCRTPWDYCCETKEERLAHSLLVEFRGADGSPVATPVIPEARRCDLVKVTGALTIDEQGNPVLIADGLFRVERPELPADVAWPE
ncbi:MAG: hypothetical protein IPM29_06645 [Planctomycetes bacterium]|nr:hypothetical protein [Planctomycetota bacterium]